MIHLRETFRCRVCSVSRHRSERLRFRNDKEPHTVRTVTSEPEKEINGPPVVLSFELLTSCNGLSKRPD